MSEEFSRTQRVSELIRRELSPPLQVLSRDENLGLITITSVDVSPDLKQALVYITAMGTSLESKALISAVNQHAGPLRHHLSVNMKIRTIPKLRFVYDESVERGVRLSALIDSLSVPAKEQDD